MSQNEEMKESSGNSSTVDMINALDISDKMKSQITLVYETYQKTNLGWPVFKKPANFSLPKFNMTRTSLLAFFFPWIYYFVKGMWKKGLVLLLISLPVFILPGVIVIASLFASQSAYYDLYRKLVKKEDFWW